MKHKTNIELERMKFHMKRNTFKKVLDLKTEEKENITDYVVKLENKTK